jgi:hypothetical protein
LLSLVGSVGSASLGGCFTSEATPRYQLSAGNVPGKLADHLRWENRRGQDSRANRETIEALVAEGSLTTAGFLVLDTDSIRYTEQGGDFYEIAVERTGTVEREHWIFWFDLIDGEPPASAEVFTSSLGTGRGTDLQARYGLKERDERVVEDAAGEIVREFDLHDPEDDPAGRRGHVFVRRSESETDLLPEPPFTHVAFEVNDTTRYARAITERAAVELQHYSYRSELVAQSTSDFEQYVREQHLETTFDRNSLPASQQNILDTITRGGGRHEEREPLSEALQTVLDRLGLQHVETPDPRSVSFSDEVFFRYQDGYFSGELQIFR